MAFEHSFKDGESVWIGKARVTMHRLAKGTTRLRIDAPDGVKIELESKLDYETTREKMRELRESKLDSS